MWQFKKEYKGKKIGVRGFGVLDTNTMSAELVHKISLQPEFNKLIRYIESAEVQKPKKVSKSK